MKLYYCLTRPQTLDLFEMIKLQPSKMELFSFWYLVILVKLCIVDCLCECFSLSLSLMFIKSNYQKKIFCVTMLIFAVGGWRVWLTYFYRLQMVILLFWVLCMITACFDLYSWLNPILLTGNRGQFESSWALIWAWAFLVWIQP